MKLPRLYEEIHDHMRWGNLVNFNCPKNMCGLPINVYVGHVDKDGKVTRKVTCLGRTCDWSAWIKLVGYRPRRGELETAKQEGSQDASRNA